MKPSKVLSILAVSADHLESFNGSYYIPFLVKDQCSVKVPQPAPPIFQIRGGTFETTNNGSSGELKLEDYGSHTGCQHTVKTSCQAIQIKYRSVKVQVVDEHCEDFFMLEWFDPSVKYPFGYLQGDHTMTTGRLCGCLGDGCQSSPLHNVYENNDHRDDYTFEDYYGFSQEEIDHLVGPDDFTINANSFTFFFNSNNIYDGGHVILDWECTTPTTSTTTTTSITSTPTTISTTTTSEIDRELCFITLWITCTLFLTHN